MTRKKRTLQKKIASEYRPQTVSLRSLERDLSVSRPTIIKVLRGASAPECLNPEEEEAIRNYYAKGSKRVSMRQLMKKYRAGFRKVQKAISNFGRSSSHTYPKKVGRDKKE